MGRKQGHSECYLDTSSEDQVCFESLADPGLVCVIAVVVIVVLLLLLVVVVLVVVVVKDGMVYAS